MVTTMLLALDRHPKQANSNEKTLGVDYFPGEISFKLVIDFLS